jgi:hypothetical protein
MEKELIIRNKVFLQQYNNTLKQFDAESWFIPKGNSTKMFDSSENSDHTVPSRDTMVYRPSFYPLKEARERRMKANQFITNTIQIPLQRARFENGTGYPVNVNKMPSYEPCVLKHEDHVDNLSGYAVPLEPEDDICIEEILVGLGEASDGWYHPSPLPHYERPQHPSLPPRKRYSDVHVPSQEDDISPPASPFYPSLSPYVRVPVRDVHNNMVAIKKRKMTPPLSPEDEPRLVESSDEKENIYFDDEIELDSHKRKTKRMHRNPMKKEQAVEGATYEVGGLCGKTNKPRQRKEYFYSKNSKTIFRWTCCGSQAKDHPDF